MRIQYLLFLVIFAIGEKGNKIIIFCILRFLADSAINILTKKILKSFTQSKNLIIEELTSLKSIILGNNLMNILVRFDSGFEKYLEETQNTICGRHPISILLYVFFPIKSYFYFRIDYQ